MDGQPPGSSPDIRSRVRAALESVTTDVGLTGLPAALQRVCRAACVSVPGDGSALQVMANARSGTVLASSDAASARVAETAFDVGEGPCLAAFASSRPVLVPDLSVDGMAAWPGFSSMVGERGVAACFSFPLQIGAVRLGVLDLYRNRRGGLTRDAEAVALMLADVARDHLLEPSDTWPVATLDGDLSRALDHHAEIHQAQGMVTVDLDVDLGQAIALMRSHAFRRGLPLIELARAILAGEQLPAPDD